MDVYRQQLPLCLSANMQQEQQEGAQLRPERDSAHNPSNNNNVKDGARANESVEGVDGGVGSGGVSNGTYGASFGHPKIGGQAPSASVGVGGEPAKNDEATPR